MNDYGYAHSEQSPKEIWIYKVHCDELKQRLKLVQQR